MITNTLIPSLIFATLLVTFALHVHAEETQGDPVSVRGLVVSTGHALTINDGVRDYVLLGVDNPEYEGKICEAFGEIRHIDGMPTIDVMTITIISDEYPDEDLVGARRGLGSPFSRLHLSGMHQNAWISPGVAMSARCTLSLPIWDGSGMRVLGDATNTVDPHAASHTHQQSGLSS